MRPNLQPAAGFSEWDDIPVAPTPRKTGEKRTGAPRTGVQKTSEAFAWDDAPVAEDAAKPASEAEEKADLPRRRWHRVRNAERKSFSLLSVLLVAAIVALGILSVNCSIVQNERNSQLRRLQTELAETQDLGARMEIEIEQRSDHFAIEAYATQKLGMRRLETYQVQYIRDDVFSNAVLLNQERDEGFFADVTKAFSVLNDFFR